MDGEVKVTINYDRIADDSKWDGLKGYPGWRNDEVRKQGRVSVAQTQGALFLYAAASMPPPSKAYGFNFSHFSNFSNFFKFLNLSLL